MYEIDFNAYGLACRFLSLVFLEAPTAQFVDGLVKQRLLDDWPLQGEDDTDAILDLLDRFLGQWEDGQLEALEADYTRLFVGLERTLAPPYESVFLSRDHLMFEKQTLEVREHYKAYGLVTPEKNRVPDDHLGFELHFVSHLCDGVTASTDGGALEKAERMTADLKSFLDVHLSQWLDAWVKRVLEHAGTDYYRGMARLARETVWSLGRRL